MKITYGRVVCALIPRSICLISDLSPHVCSVVVRRPLKVEDAKMNSPTIQVEQVDRVCEVTNTKMYLNNIA